MISRVAQGFLIAMVRLYRVAISPLIGPRCRFMPSCSEYAIQAIHRHGACCGARLSLTRLLRCHPWGGSGIDEVPLHPPVRSAPTASSHRAHPKSH